MADCECVPKCPFFNDRMVNMPTLAETMKKKYCQGGFDQCARHIVFKVLGSPGVPLDLFPNQTERVPSLLKQPA